MKRKHPDQLDIFALLDRQHDPVVVAEPAAVEPDPEPPPVSPDPPAVRWHPPVHWTEGAHGELRIVRQAKPAYPAIMSFEQFEAETMALLAPTKIAAFPSEKLATLIRGAVSAIRRAPGRRRSILAPTLRKLRKRLTAAGLPADEVECEASMFVAAVNVELERQRIRDYVLGDGDAA